jgi:thiamine-phosphate pyrophosphorylase
MIINQQTAIYRILDANLDRAREGLRIIEEWCRFGLSNRTMAEECKQMRQELASWHSCELRTARDTPTDPGTELTHPQEEERSTIEDLLQANLCRIQEALRVLEEYGKLYNRDLGITMKQMRYQVYTLESNLLAQRRQQLLQQARLYLVSSPSDNLFPVIEASLQAGLSIVQYRHKDADDLVKLAEAYKLCQLCHDYGALFIVNDRLDLALAVNADGVHLGQKDLPAGLARQMLGSQKIIGKSTTNPEEMEKAIAENVDYIGVGPVYETPTKPGKAAAGLEYVRYAASHATVPWFAIGGIDPNNIVEVLKAGATRVAVVRSIMESEQPAKVTQYFLSQLMRKQSLLQLEAKLEKSHS